ncbi:MAG: ASCH domain-containing protein [Bacteroidota bacterium]
MITESVKVFWQAFQKRNPEHGNFPCPEPWHFCDNQKDADECADLVVRGIKQATSPSVWWYEKNQHDFPEVGELNVITNWAGEPKAVIQTTKLEFVSYQEVTAAYAFVEGEGDRSLEYWRKVHWEYFQREMSPYGEHPTPEMIIVCEYFQTVYTNNELTDS